MSHATTQRLPLHVQNFIKLYEKLHTSKFKIKDIRARSYLQSQSFNNARFMQSQILNGIDLASSTLPPIHKQMLGPLFEKFKYDELESYSTEELFKPQFRPIATGKQMTTEDLQQLPDDILRSYTERKSRIMSNDTKTSTHTSKFQAKIMKGLSAYYQPLTSIPNTQFHSNILRWYLRLLNYTPIILILKQKRHLYSDDSINGINISYSNLKQAINQLTIKYENSRSYHLTELTDIDIFQLAVKSQQEFLLDELNSSSLNTDINWDKCLDIEDSLCSNLFREKNIEVLRNDQPFTDSVDTIFKIYNIDNIVADLDFDELTNIFPFDLAFNEYFILTIENDILHNNHHQMIQALKGVPDIELLSVRLDTSSPLVTNALESRDMFESDSWHQQITTDDSNKQQETVHKSSIDSLFDEFIELGMAKVNKGSNNCIYLFNK